MSGLSAARFPRPALFTEKTYVLKPEWSVHGEDTLCMRLFGFFFSHENVVEIEGNLCMAGSARFRGFPWWDMTHSHIYTHRLYNRKYTIERGRLHNIKTHKQQHTRITTQLRVRARARTHSPTHTHKHKHPNTHIHSWFTHAHRWRANAHTPSKSTHTHTHTLTHDCFIFIYIHMHTCI